MNLFNIREAIVADIPLIRELTYKVWPQTYSNIISKQQIDYMLELMYSETALQQQMQNDCQFLILFEEYIPIGFASFQKIREQYFQTSQNLYIT